MRRGLLGAVTASLLEHVRPEGDCMLTVRNQWLGKQPFSCTSGMPAQPCCLHECCHCADGSRNTQLEGPQHKSAHPSVVEHGFSWGEVRMSSQGRFKDCLQNRCGTLHRCSSGHAEKFGMVLSRLKDHTPVPQLPALSLT